MAEEIRNVLSMASFTTPEHIATVLSNRYSHYSFLAILVYDHLITLDTEAEQIWSTPWKVPKVLFVINRYVVPPMLCLDVLVSAIPNLPESFCRQFITWQVWPTLFAIVLTEAIVILRVYAIYSNSKTVFWMLLAVYFCIVSPMITFAIWLNVDGPFTTMSNIESLVPGCYAPPPFFMQWFWLCPLIFEGIAVVLTAYKIIQLKIFQPAHHPVFFVFVRDSMGYFVVVFIGLFLTFINWHYPSLASPVEDYGGFLLAGCVACVTGSRLTLNLRSISNAEVPELQNLSTLHFGHP